MISVTKTMNILKAEGIIKDWSKTQRDARIYDDSDPLFETVINVTPADDAPLVRVDNEVYGDKAMLYFYCRDAETAQAIADTLRFNGGDPSFRWCSDSPDRFDMQVSYFKGCRWWE